MKRMGNVQTADFEEPVKITIESGRMIAGIIFYYF